MMEAEYKRVVIVEGLSDKKHIAKIIKEDIDIICTNGTLGITRFDELLYDYDLDNRDVFILVDEDRTGRELRELFFKELPHAEHIYIQKEYREVEKTPESLIATLLVANHIRIDPTYLL